MKPTEPAAREVWARLQALRLEHWQGDGTPRGQALSDARRRNLHARRVELRRAGYGLDDLYRAAVWVMGSPNIRAEGARKTGDPLQVLLRPSKCLDYVELALAEEDGARLEVERPEARPEPKRAPQPRRYASLEEMREAKKAREREAVESAAPNLFLVGGGQ